MVYLADIMVIRRSFSRAFGRFRQSNLKFKSEKYFLDSSSGFVFAWDMLFLGKNNGVLIGCPVILYDNHLSTCRACDNGQSPDISSQKLSICLAKSNLDR